jgi:hypothetical protein
MSGSSGAAGRHCALVAYKHRTSPLRRMCVKTGTLRVVSITVRNCPVTAWALSGHGPFAERDKQKTRLYGLKKIVYSLVLLSKKKNKKNNNIIYNYNYI